MADRKTKIIIETESGNSEQKLKNISKDLQQISNAGKSTSFSIKQSTSSMTSSFIALGAKVAAVTVTIKKAYSMAREAAQFQEIALYTKAATENIGLSFERLKEASERGANGMADSVTIMKANLRALKQGLNATEEEIGQLWKIANATGDELGQSIEQTFEQIVQAINTGNGRALIQLGVLPENFKRSADSAELLANKGKLLKTVLDQLGTSADRLGKYGDTAFDKFQQLENAFSDLKMAASEGLVPALTPVVEMLTEIVRTATKATSAISTLAGLKKPENPYLSLSLDEIRSRMTKAKDKIAALSYVPGNDPSKSYRESNGKGGAGYGTHVGVAGIVNSNDKAELQFYEQAYAKLKEAEEYNLNLAKKRREEADKINQKNAETAFKLKDQKKQIEGIFGVLTGININQDKINNKIEEERKQREKLLEIQIKQREEQERAFKAFANLADETLPKVNASEKVAYDELVRISKIVGGFSSGYNVTEALLKRQDQEDSWKKYNEQVKYNDYWNNFIKQSNNAQQNAVFNQMLGLSNAVLPNIELSEVPEVAKKGWKAIEGQVVNDFSEAVTSGIINSNLGDALRGAITSIAGSKAQSYGSTLLSGLFGNKGVNVAGALSGFVGSIAVGAIANNWKKWFSDRNKTETINKNMNTEQAAANAYLSTYSAMFNPYMTDDLYSDLLDARWAYQTGNLTVSNKGKKRGGLPGLAGYKDYRDTTPSNTYSVIDAINNTVKTVEEYNKYKEKELDLLSAQGKDYQVLGSQLDALKATMDRVQYYSDKYSTTWVGWGNMAGKRTYEIDLSDNIQDLKKAYYEALREYGEETGARNQQKANTFMSLYPYLDNYYGLVSMGNGYYSTPNNDNRNAMYSLISGTQENLLNRQNDWQMLAMIQQASKEQFELASMQYTTEDTSKYTEAYLNVLERQKQAAELVMQEQEQIYRDMSKTFEEQAAALETYQQAQEQYYNTKLEILAQEKAKEEQLKKEEQQAKLRSADRMEALLGFTGEMAKRGDNNIYILEGADQIGALREMEKYIDDPEALAFVQRLITAALNKNKYGKIG